MREIKYHAWHEGREWNVITRKAIRPNHKGYHKQNGYVMRLVTEHPFSNKRGYVAEHRLVMESNLTRFLMPNEFIHHKDQNRENNDLSNLHLYTGQSDHAKEHAVDSERRKTGQFSVADPKLESKKFRLLNLDTGAWEIRTLGNLINTTFRKGKFEYRGEWTGLKDKNGVEIFEGDIIKWEREDLVEAGSNIITRSGVGLVEWNETFAMFSISKTNKYGCFQIEGQDFEVIGDVYQHPELLAPRESSGTKEG